ncbi:MAG: hypothetical protein WC623_00835 [Pedobacter sp.]|uniref:hypothetical protein n=1 Tax=Pedobacter sp. TaxID=1411316 RepID=UPI0035633907
MNKELRIKELKRELLEIEGRELQNVERGSNNLMGSGGVIIAIGAICLTIGAANAMFWLLILGPVTMLIGVLMMSNAKSNLNEFEQKKKERAERILKIKMELVDLE